MFRITVLTLLALHSHALPLEPQPEGTYALPDESFIPGYEYLFANLEDVPKDEDSFEVVDSEYTVDFMIHRIPNSTDKLLHHNLFDKCAEEQPVSSQQGTDTTAGVALLCYHKTGTVLLLQQLRPLIAEHLTLKGNPAIENSWWPKDKAKTHFPDGGSALMNFSSGGTAPSAGYQGQVTVVNLPSCNWPLPASNIKTVLFYRDPISVVISGFQYHRHATSAETWEKLTKACAMCDAEANHEIFSTCYKDEYKAKLAGPQCNYISVLKHVHDKNETESIHLETFHDRLEAYHITGNMQRWKNTPNVLQVSLDSISEDYEATYDCLSKFLLAEGKQRDDLREKLFSLQLKYEAQKHTSRHETASKYVDQNKRLREILQANPEWLPGQAGFKDLEKSIWKRQADMFGCKVPKNV